jgi:hypothetical protein
MSYDQTFGSTFVPAFSLNDCVQRVRSLTGAAVRGEVALALTELKSTVNKAKLATAARILVWIFTAYLFYVYIQVSALGLN